MRRFQEITQSIRNKTCVCFSMQTNCEPAPPAPVDLGFAKHWSLGWFTRPVVVTPTYGKVLTAHCFFALDGVDW